MRNSLSLVTALTLGMACDGQERITFEGPELRQFESCSQTQDYLAEVMLNTALEHRYGMGWGMLESTPDAAANEGDSSGPSDYTTTNVQEEGVDEVDLVKTDGEYIYVGQDKGFHIVDSWPVEEAHKLATIEFSGWIRGIFLHGDRIVVLSTGNEEIPGFDNYSHAKISIVDISTKENPQIVKEYALEGWLGDARMIDGDIYAIANHYSYLPEEFWDFIYEGDIELPEVDWHLEGDEFTQDLEEKREQARELLREPIKQLAREIDVQDIFPKWKNGEQVQDLYSCEEIFRPGNASRFNVLSLLHVDLEEDTMTAQGLMAEGWTVYSSKENFYIAQSGRWWWWGWGDVDMNSHIHKFALNGGEKPTYEASGAVSGWLYDQFAMSEYDGHLRVASTDFDWWMGSSEEDSTQAGNNVTVLYDDGKGTLQKKGEITGIAPGERIFANRMMGEQGYMVTFRQVDPLYTLDLSDHSNPKVIGELKIPGYSAYLHPIDENHLLAVGMDGEEDGTLTGLAINIFDVSDFENPTLKYQHVLESDGWSWSESLWDHHAFTFHRDVLTIPAYSWNYSEDEGYDLFSGVLSFSIDTSVGIEEIGRVDHSSLLSESQCLYEIWYGDYYNDCNNWYYQPYVRRSLYIEDNLFSLSNYGLKVNDLYDPSQEITDVLFYPEAE